MKLRFVWVQLFATLVAFLLLTSPAAWAGSTASHTDSKRLQAGPALTQYLPAETPLVVSLLDDPQALHEFKQRLPGSSRSQQGARALAQWPQAILATAGLDYQRDIQPWVDDEVTLALTALDRQRTPSQASGYVLAFSTRRAADAQACLEQLWQQQVAVGLSLTYERYQGISLISADRAPLDPIALAAGVPKAFQPFSQLATAVFNGRQVVVTDSVDTLHTIIDSAQAFDQSLMGTPAYQAGIKQLQHNPQLGVVYANLAALADQTGLFTGLTTSRYQSLMVGLDDLDQGLFAETILVADPSQSITRRQPQVKKGIAALDFVPSQSALVAAGVNLKQLWRQVQEELASYPQLSTWVEAMLNQGGKPWRLNLAQDILPAVSGDYALAMLPPSQATLRSRPLDTDWVFVLAKRDNEQVTLTIDEAADQQKVGVFPYPLGNQQVSAWAHLAPTGSTTPDSESLVLKAELLGGYAVKQGHKVMATSLPALQEALAGAPRSIAQQDGFQRAIAPFQRPNQGYFYLNWPVMRPIIKSKVPLLIQLEDWVGPWLKNLQSVSVANYGETSTALRSHVLLQWTPS